MKNAKKEPWRIAAFILSIVCIVFLWSKNGIAEACSALPPDEAAAMVVTSIAVSLVKVALIAGGVWLVRWLIGRGKGKSADSDR